MLTRRVLSLGGGVQSSALFYMWCHDELSADAAIFADTGNEPKSVYDNVAYLTRYGNRHGKEIYTVQKGNLMADILSKEKGNCNLPYYVDSSELVQIDTPEQALLFEVPRTKIKKKTGKFPRQCTYSYKMHPIRRKLRELYPDASHRRPVTTLIGISTDEIQRMKPSGLKWCVNAWPLVARRMDRQSCREYITSHNLPMPSRSACIMCPYHSDAEWRALSDADFKASWQFEEQVNKTAAFRDFSGGYIYIVHSNRSGNVRLPRVARILSTAKRRRATVGTAFYERTARRQS